MPTNAPGTQPLILTQQQPAVNQEAEYQKYLSSKNNQTLDMRDQRQKRDEEKKWQEYGFEKRAAEEAAKKKAEADAKKAAEKKMYSDLVNNTRQELVTAQEKAREKEDLLKGQMLSAAQASNRAIDEQLASLIDQTGFITGLQGQAVGAQQAATGMLRSGQTAQRIGNAQLNRQQAIGGMVSSAEEQKRGIEQQVVQTQEQINQRRQELDTQLKMAELESYTQLQKDKNFQDLKMKFQNYINDLETSAANKQALYQAIGSLGQVGGIVAGYNMGQSSGQGTQFNFTPINTKVGLTTPTVSQPSIAGQQPAYTLPVKGY